MVTSLLPMLGLQLHKYQCAFDLNSYYKLLILIPLKVVSKLGNVGMRLQIHGETGQRALTGAQMAEWKTRSRSQDGFVRKHAGECTNQLLLEVIKWHSSTVAYST